MDSRIMQDYTDSIIKSYVRVRKSLLLLDEFKAHKNDQVFNILYQAGVKNVLVAAWFTHMLQPLDVCVNKPIKSIMRKAWQDWFENSEPIRVKQ